MTDESKMVKNSFYMYVIAPTKISHSRIVQIAGVETSFYSRVTSLSFNTSIWSDTHARNNCGSTDYRLGTWFGYLVHTWRFYSHSIGYCDHRYRNSCYSGQASALIGWDFHRPEFEVHECRLLENCWPMLLFEWITQNPILSGTKLIIEPSYAAEVLQRERVFPSGLSEVERTPPVRCPLLLARQGKL